MAVRAKFRVTGMNGVGDLVTINMQAVNRGDADGPSDPNNPYSAEDSVFGRFTPSGSVSMAIKNPAASDQFEVGKAYYLDFTPADAD